VLQFFIINKKNLTTKITFIQALTYLKKAEHILKMEEK